MRRNEEKQSRTQQLYIHREQALRELGYEKLTAENHEEVLDKMAEIESRYL